MRNNGVVRPTIPADTPFLLALAEQSQVFKPIEITALNEVLDDYHAAMQGLRHQSVTFEMNAAPAGFAYYAPAAMTDRTWYLYWIAVATTLQGGGIGSRLLKHVEDDVLMKSGRHLLIETSSLPHYEPTRRFYAKHGYEQTAVIAEYYAEGDDMVIFRKKLATRS